MSGVDHGTTTRRRSANTAGRARPAAARRDDTRIWWNVANVIDVIHFPIVIALVVLGAVYFSGPVFVFLLTLMVVLQVAVLGCPVMWLTGQLRRVHDPDYDVRWSFTAWLYERYGRWVGVAVFCTLAAITVALRFWLF
jgi:hypothetical protein